MNKFKRTLLAGVVATSFGFGVAGTAHADALGTSILQLNNLTFNDANGAILVNGTNVSVIGFTESARAQATLNGTTQNSGLVSNSTGAIDLAPRCVGACADPRLQNNVFGVFSTAVGDPIVTVSSADQREAGSPIVGIGTLTPPASVEASAITSLVGSNTGDAQAQNGLTSQFVFMVTSTGQILINFHALGYLEAFVTPGFGGENANATYSTSFRLTQNVGGQQVTIFTWAPDGVVNALAGAPGGIELEDDFTLNATVASIDPAGGASFVGASAGVKNSGDFRALTPILIAGQVYTLTAAMDTNVNAVSVPEPATLGLMGLALLGMGAFRRRQRA